MTYTIREYNSNNLQVMEVFGYGIQDAAYLLDQVTASREKSGQVKNSIKGYDGYVSGYVFFNAQGTYQGYVSMQPYT